MGPVAPPQGFAAFVYVMLILVYGIVPVTTFGVLMWATRRLPFLVRMSLAGFAAGAACGAAARLADWYWFAQSLW